MKWIGIICLAISMSVIYPITDLKSGLVMIAFGFGLNFFVYGAIDERD